MPLIGQGQVCCVDVECPGTGHERQLELTPETIEPAFVEEMLGSSARAVGRPAGSPKDNNYGDHDCNDRVLRIEVLRTSIEPVSS